MSSCWQREVPTTGSTPRSSAARSRRKSRRRQRRPRLSPVAIGAGLMVMVYMGGHVSGAHYNPAVSFGVFLRRKLTATDLALYWITQLVAAALAFTFGYVVSGHAGGIHPGAHVVLGSAIAAEIAFTAA